jgi:hypothetical protein
MKKLFASIVLVAALGIAWAALADDAHSTMGKAMAKSPTKTLTGELVDTGCYLGHGAKGEKHIDCATKCIANGMPMGLLTADGTLYLITLDHENADPYNALKNMAGKTVTVTGTVMTRNGMKGIDVTEAKEAAAAASK